MYFAEIPLEKLTLIRGVHKEPTVQDLLQKCQKGFTQNLNESLHEKLLAEASKAKYFGLFRVTFLVRVIT